MFTSVRVPSGFLVANHQYSNESKCLKWPLKNYLSGTKNINNNYDNNNNNKNNSNKNNSNNNNSTNNNINNDSDDDNDNDDDDDETTIVSQNTREQGLEKK